MTRIRPALGLAAAGALALILGGCGDADSPQIEASSAYLGGAGELPYAEPAQVRWREPERAYLWAERAYGLQRAFYDTPPDYAFEDEGIMPLVWESADDWVMYAEPWDSGYRYYYYEPGSAYPYFVLVRDYGLAFDDAGFLVAVFDIGGRYLPKETVYSLAPVAGRYYVRGRDLRIAAAQAPRLVVTYAFWSDAAPLVARNAIPWLQAARSEGAWRAWRERNGDRELSRFERERSPQEAKAQARRPAVRQPERLARPEREARGAVKPEKDHVAPRAERPEPRQPERLFRQPERREHGWVERREPAQAQRPRQIERGQERVRVARDERRIEARPGQGGAVGAAPAPAAESKARPAAARERGGKPAKVQTHGAPAKSQGKDKKG